jgi:hypothetical protein
MNTKCIMYHDTERIYNGVERNKTQDVGDKSPTSKIN